MLRIRRGPSSGPGQAGRARTTLDRSVAAAKWVWFHPWPTLGRRSRIGLGAAGAALVLFTGWLVVPAATEPGNDSLVAKVAERARDHGLGFLVTALEQVQYAVSPPREGGEPSALPTALPGVVPGPSAGGDPQASPSSPSTNAPPSPLDHVPGPIRPFAAPALDGEGVWRTTVTLGGRPAVQVAQVRPDRVHTSYLTGVAWMNGQLLRFEQHPGASDPGRLAQWSQPATIPAERRSGLVATFNSGFKLADARGGYYADGHTVGRLRPGAASFVVHRDGSVEIGAWGSDVRMSDDVVSVRQNLGLLLADGRPTPEVDGDSQSTWGATIGAKAYVWRSGVGVTADGDIVFAAGDALSAGTLAAVLARAGAVRAMELDINRDWVSYMWYSPGSAPTAPVPHKLVDFWRPADRYFSLNNRDFFAVYAR